MKNFKSHTYKAIIGLSIAAIAIGFQNCDGGFSTNSEVINQSLTNDSTGLDTGEVNHKPVMDCEITSKTRSDIFIRLHSISDTFSTNRFNDSDELMVDCGNTTDESKISDLKFEIDAEYDRNDPNFVEMQLGTTNIGVMPYGINPVAIKITDPQGMESLKTVNIPTECTSSDAPVLANPSSSISVTKSSSDPKDVGLFNYSVDTSKISGGNSFTFSWDFNGDGVYDPFAKESAGSKALWTTSPNLTEIYSNYEDTRSLRLSIRNECMIETSYTFNPNMTTIHPVARNASSLATMEPYYYVQGDIRDTTAESTDLDDQRRNGNYLATDNQGYTNFTCSLNNHDGKSAINITQTKQYRSENYAIGGMSLKITNVPDDGVQSSLSIPYNVAELDITHSIAGESDGILKDSYVETTDPQKLCKVKLRLIRKVGSVPCESGPAAETLSTEVLGEFECPELLNPAGESLSIQHGKFYCGFGTADKCIGGGGGGGGGVPPLEL